LLQICVCTTIKWTKSNFEHLNQYMSTIFDKVELCSWHDLCYMQHLIDMWNITFGFVTQTYVAQMQEINIVNVI
jgi:hypothetical protein